MTVLPAICAAAGRNVGWQRTALPAHIAKSSLDGLHSDRLRALGPLTDVELNPLVFLQ